MYKLCYIPPCSSDHPSSPYSPKCHVTYRQSVICFAPLTVGGQTFSREYSSPYVVLLEGSMHKLKAYWEDSPAETGYFCRKKTFLPKEAVSAAVPKGQNKTERVSAEFLPKFSAEIRHFGHFGRPLAKRHSMHIIE